MEAKERTGQFGEHLSGPSRLLSSSHERVRQPGQRWEIPTTAAASSERRFVVFLSPSYSPVAGTVLTQIRGRTLVCPLRKNKKKRTGDSPAATD
ncbi:hypothetical protein MTO96_020723 [Rhipicephalus appendiculatus]